MEQIIEKINFGEFDSQKRKMHLLERSAPTPARKEKRESLAYMQGDYDFSGLDGQEYHENRELSYTFYVLERDYDYRKHNQTVIENELMRYGEIPLYDSYSVGYYYHAKCMGVRVTDDHLSNRLIIEITFKGYPFKTSILPEGHDLVAFINVDLDVRQYTTFDVNPGIEYRQPETFSYRQLNIGDTATYGAWSGHYVNDIDETGREINPRIRGYSDTVTDKRQIQIWNRSRWAYKMKSNGLWLREQDIIEAYTEFEERTIVNPGIVEVAPTITLESLGGNGSMTVIKDDNIYNLKPGKYSTEHFMLKPGQNKLRMYTRDGARIHFNFYKELI